MRLLFVWFIGVATFVHATPLVPEKEPCSEAKNGVYFFGDFLWWKADNSGFTYAFDQTVDTTSFPNVGKIIQIQSKWDPGFQVGIGFNTRHNDWDLIASWTWYQNQSNDAHQITVPSSAVGQGFYPIWPVALTVKGGTDLGPYTEISAHWRLLLNAVDAELCKMVYKTADFSLQLQYGGRAAWLNQEFHNRFLNPIPSVSATAISEFAFTGKNNYWGVGPITAFQSNWRIYRGFSLIGKMATALLYGRTDVKNVSERLEPLVIHHEFTQGFNQMVPYFQMLLGFQWGFNFRSETMHFEIQASWETNYWWNQFNVPVSFEGFASPMPSVGNSPLSTEGITVNVQLNF